MSVSGNFFDVLGVKPMFGRGFRPDEDQVPGRDAVVVLGHDFWKNEFGGDRSIIGRHMRLGPGASIDFTIIGVAPESFPGMDLFICPAFFVPAMMTPRILGRPESILTARGVASVENDFNMKARLKPDVSVSAANAEVAAIGKSLAEAFPEIYRGRTMIVRTEREARVAL
jgi:hypothetical protein